MNGFYVCKDPRQVHYKCSTDGGAAGHEAKKPVGLLSESPPVIAGARKLNTDGIPDDKGGDAITALMIH